MNRNIFIVMLLGALVVLEACNSGYTRRNPGKNYAPDMTYSRAYDAYTLDPAFAGDSMVSRLPVPGTIARGQALPHNLTNMDTAAYSAITNPYTFNEKELDEGRRLYNIYCGICHGEKLDGNGPLYKSGKFAAMPANLTDPKFTAFTPGRIYFAIVYGRNMMGSYASQLNDKQRWMVIDYIKSVTTDGNTATPSDSAQATADTATTAAK